MKKVIRKILRRETLTSRPVEDIFTKKKYYIVKWILFGWVIKVSYELVERYHSYMGIS